MTPEQKLLRNKVEDNKQAFVLIRNLMELDLRDVQDSLCDLIGKPDLLPVLQGKAQKLKEYIKLLT